MATSIVEICNLALGRIGAARIASLDAASREARECKARWQPTCAFVFRMVPWKCIAKRIELTETTDTPAWGYAYAYVLPADYVRMIGFEYADTAYHEVGNVLHTDENGACIDYVYNCQDATKYSGDLVRALELCLAYDIGFGLTQNDKLVNQVQLDFEKFFLPLVRFTNSVGAGQRIQQASTFTDMFAARN